MNYNGYSKEWIIDKYKNAKHKTEQIEILAELTASDETTILTILNDAGVREDTYKICNTCGKPYLGEYRRGHSNKCPECRAYERDYYRKRSMFKKNMEKIRELNDKNLLLIEELETLKRRLK